ncbi:MAG: TolC family protein [Candidatus Marinimicrobia bacterium]|jgi:outer membrane protein TolC|nr:TolC family protein [Candidatus Neomarinimicrobiota bacterium]MBT3632823.1 TolC family protein [Candidatus Neomarinimicrobiota bacterium]MBT3681933.1 TolC family protein [Candidatus Neomarinimicrobiota bacterium]MBT3759038.1 TolC family protein [Candidatus Neomarinimicrobiota bacterium]MBT3895063.1 TolC family protein [Candidatus Neomarinimicrobiota bacterium]
MQRTPFMVLVSVLSLAIIIPQSNDKDHQLNNLISKALDHNPEILAWQSIVHSKKQASIAAGSLPNPVLSGGYFVEPVVTKEGPQEFKLGLAQNLPWPGKLNTQKLISQADADISIEKSRQSILKVVNDIRRKYHQLRLLATEENITEENLSLLKQFESVVRTKYSTASASHSYLVQIQMKMIRMEDKLTSLKNKRPVIISKLEQLTGVGLADFSFDFDTAEFETDLPTSSPVGIANNPVIRISKLKTHTQENKVTLAKLASKPDFLLGVDYIMLDAESADNPIMVKAGISLPIWFGRNKAIQESAKAGLDSEELNLTNAQELLAVKIEEINYRLVDYQRQYLLHIEELLPLAEQNYQITETGYLADELDFTTYLNVEEDLLDLKLKTARLRYNYYIAIADYLEISAMEY